MAPYQETFDGAPQTISTARRAGRASFAYEAGGTTVN